MSTTSPTPAAAPANAPAETPCTQPASAMLSVRALLQRSGFTLDVDAALPLAGVTALFGRSGCGKTSLLRVIAGLDRAAGAEVRFGDAVWQYGRHFVPLHRRRIGLVFQEHSLLPHLGVRDNLLYGYRRTPPAERRLHLQEVVDMLGIGELLARSIDTLSGGQRQRVSLGRALLTSPRLMLLDEPLSALDTATKREIMPFLSRLAAEAGVPIVMVSHAPDEVERLADRVVFMHAGRIERIETLRQALARADSPLFADAGAVSVLEGLPGAAGPHGLRAFGPEGARLWLSASGTLAGEEQAGGRSTSQPPTDETHAPPRRLQRLRILARDVSLALDDPTRISIQNHLRVTIERIDTHAPGRALVSCRMADGQLLLAEVTPWSVAQLGLAPGQQVYALIKSVALLG
ncbi:molybdenum ABC transporter ATP-binding protein [Thauera mechernichensis]|uniref:Molybdenum ABC transporter ATP-binding protein n=1 Tax=Thauera mechernichensis TaxID=82788 RepID=A0ABW3WAQ5_9RHOO|nr:molybdenum ABC transporter ATP-binding protein [Thauera mechernichensis]MDG3064439.1 molybdenum ABC transporter ATP-binding protein [Thauera mechernichensis]